MINGVVLATVRLLAALPSSRITSPLLRASRAARGQRPAVAEDVLVEILAAPDAEEEAAGHHRGDGGGSLSDDRRVEANVGHVTPVPTRIVSVACAIPPSIDQTNGLWPWGSIQGWKWSGDQREREAGSALRRRRPKELVRRMILRGKREAELGHPSLLPGGRSGETFVSLCGPRPFLQLESNSDRGLRWQLLRTR